MRSWTHLVRLALPLGLLGCIDFGGQDLTFHHDAVNDRLLVFQVFTGIHTTGDFHYGESNPVNGKSPEKKVRGPSPAEIEELESVITGQRTFFFSNWITEYDRADCEKIVADAAARGPLQDVDATGDLSPEKSKDDAHLALCQQLLTSIEVINGKFFLDRAHHLCAYQQVTVNNVSKMLVVANTFIDTLLTSDPLDKYSPAERAKLHNYAANHGPWVELHGNELRIRYWARDEEFVAPEGRLLENSLNQIVINYDDPIVEVIIGRPHEWSTELAMAKETPTDQSLNKYVRKHYGVERNVDLDALRRNFLGVGPAAP